MAADFELVRDVYDVPKPDVGIDEIVAVGSSVYFNVQSNFGSRSLWRTDGTTEGTAKVLDGDVRELTSFGGALWFAGSIGSQKGLFKLDAAAASPLLVHSISPNAYPFYFREFTAAGSLLYFVFESASTDELWRSNGTMAGTFKVATETLPGSTSFHDLTAVGNKVYFGYGDNGLDGDNLWTSNGTTAGTRLIHDIWDNPFGSRPTGLTDVNGVLYYAARGDFGDGVEVWKVTDSGASQYSHHSYPSDVDTPANFVNVNGTVHFTAGFRGSTVQVYRGSHPFGPEAFTFATSWVPGGSPDNLVNYQGAVTYTTDDGMLGPQVWRYNEPLTSIPLATGFEPGELVSTPNFLFIAAADSAHGGELWRTNSAGDAQLVADIRPGAEGSSSEKFTVVGNRLFFVANDGIHGRQLWRTDGSELSTVRLTDLLNGTGDASPTRLTTVGDYVYFMANDGVHGTELWRTDGTHQGTELVRDFEPGPLGSRLEYLGIGDTLFISADDGPNGYELWKVEGAGEATIVREAPGAASLSPAWLTNVNGVLYFAAWDASGNELWKSDGTADGTVRVSDINPAGGSASPTELTAVNGVLYFQARSSANDFELWKYDPSTENATLVSDIRSGTSGSNPRRFADVGGVLHFSANDGVNGSELYRLDGADAVVRLSNLSSGSGVNDPIVKAGEYVYFMVVSDLFPVPPLWRTDGTALSAAPVTSQFIGSELATYNGAAYFTASDAAGMELWKCDGAGPPVRVADLAPGAAGSYPVALTVRADGLYFFALNKLWKTDGTSEGTTVLFDYGDLGLYQPTLMADFGGRLVVDSTCERFGRELWIETVEAPGDYDGDGAVDGHDFLTWQRALGSLDPMVDGNGDGVVDGLDLGMWEEHFNAPPAQAIALASRELETSVDAAMNDLYAAGDFTTLLAEPQAASKKPRWRSR